jgi:hypothetical protein
MRPLLVTHIVYHLLQGAALDVRRLRKLVAEQDDGGGAQLTAHLHAPPPPSPQHETRARYGRKLWLWRREVMRS